MEYEGHTISEPWAVFDATIADWPESYDVTYVYLDATPVILTALPGQRWRVYLRPSSPDSDLVVDATATLGAYHPDVSFVDVENPVRFQCHSEVAHGSARVACSWPATPRTCARRHKATA